MYKFLWLTLFLLGFTACISGQPAVQNKTVQNLVAEILHDSAVATPFFVQIDTFSAPFTFAISNATEVIKADTFFFRGDSLVALLPIYNAYLILPRGNNAGTGFWYQPDVDHRRTPVRLVQRDTRFALAKGNAANYNFSGKWQATMRLGANPYMAIGEFFQEGNRVTGTFMAASGDLRFLEGNVVGDTLLLSTFDGTVAYRFKGFIDGDTLRGTWHSGKSAVYYFSAFKNSAAVLPNASQIVSVKSEFANFPFRVQGLNGDEVNHTAPHLQNKVRIVQITGTWCPNCKDEGIMLREFYEKYHAKGLEIVGVSFERKDSLSAAAPAINAYSSHLKLPYTVYFGGKAAKARVLDVFPALADFYAYPTTIYIDKKGQVRHVFTGFKGQGTSEYATEKAHFESIINTLLAE